MQRPSRSPSRPGTGDRMEAENELATPEPDANAADGDSIQEPEADLASVDS